MSKEIKDAAQQQAEQQAQQQKQSSGNGMKVVKE